MYQGITEKYRQEILSLYEKGLGSERISSEIEGRFGERISARSIRKAKGKWDSEGSEVGKILTEKGMPADNWSAAWVKTKEGTVFVKNKDNSLLSMEEIREELIDGLQSFSPSFCKIDYNPVTEPHALVIDIADLHIGKYSSAAETGENYSLERAVYNGASGVAGILDKSSGFPLDQIVFVIGNDVLHVDTPHNTTTSGTRQDVGGLWFESFQAAKELYVQVIERLVQLAPVHVVHNPSNHDYMSGYMLADTIHSYFRNHPNITFDVSNAHRKYYQYGSNLIGTSHGDGAKMENLPLIMASEAKEEWSKTDFRYIYLHHIHHMKKINFVSGKDYHGVTVEYLRAVSFTDSWHHRNGYQHVPKCVTGFIHSKENGQVARITHLFK